MANPDEKLVLKPGVVATFLSDFGSSNDGDSYLMRTCDMSNKNLEQLNKCMEEAKEVYNVNLAVNNIGDPSALKELQNLMWCDLRGIKVKNINIF